MGATRLGVRLNKVVKSRTAVLIGIAGFGTALLLLPWTNLVPLSMLVLGIWGFGIWFGLPAIQTIVSGLLPAARCTLLSFNTSAHYLGGVMGAPRAGVMLGIGRVWAAGVLERPAGRLRLRPGLPGAARTLVIRKLSKWL